MNLTRTLQLIIVLFFLLGGVSCSQESKKNSEILDEVENIVEHQPESALSLLGSILYPEHLNKHQYNRFILLQLQAKDKSYKDITTDSVIFKTKTYYLQNNDFPHAAMAAYYCGRVRYEQKHYEKALFQYLEAEKYGTGIKNMNLKGLIQSAIGSVLSGQLLNEEAIPRFHTALEMMSYQLPVVAAQTGGLPEIFTDGGNEIIVKTCLDISATRFTSPIVSALAEAIDQLLSDKQLSKRLSKQAFRDVSTRFSSQMMARKYFEIAEMHNTIF